jgi:hypothetical protein
MEHSELALTEDEALEHIAYLLTSAEGGVTEPQDYAIYRLVSAADRIARIWAPRASGELATFLDNLGTQMPTEATRLDVDLEGFLKYLGEQIAELARIVKNRSSAEEPSNES